MKLRPAKSPVQQPLQGSGDARRSAPDHFKETQGFFIIPALFFVAVMGAVVVLLLEMRGIQREAHNFIKAHAQVAHIEEQLTSAVRVAAATNDATLRARYRQLELDLGQALTDAQTAASSVGMHDYLDRRNAVEQESMAGARLGELEKKVFDLLATGDANQAMAIASGIEYDRLKATYADNAMQIDQVVDHLIHVQMTIRYSAVLGLFLLLALGALLIGRMVINRIKGQRDQILSLAEETKVAKDEAEVASRAKGAFLATMSHEIRTPLTAIVGFGDIALDASSSSDERTNAVLTIRRNANHLLALINDILDMSKIEAGKLEVEHIACSPSQILQDVEQMLAGKAGEKGLSFKCWSEAALPAQIVSDPTRIKQALLNLVGNAIKFTNQGGIRIVASCDKRSNTLTIRVEDDGIGMSQEQVTKLFNPFTQADNSMTRRFGGTGLGLFITKNITERLGGRLELDSEVGRGSCFTLTLPTGDITACGWVYLEKRESPYAAPPKRTPTPLPLGTALVDSAPLPLPGGAATATPVATAVGVPQAHVANPAGGTSTLSGRVLLVEDGIDNQRLIGMILRKAGAQVDIADNGEIGLHKALEAWRSGAPYGLILMDMQMPVMDGYTAAGELRQQGYPHQIVALTAHALKGEQQQCIDAGCDHCLTKPIDKPVFLRELATRMGQASSWKEPPFDEMARIAA